MPVNTVTLPVGWTRTLALSQPKPPLGMAELGPMAQISAYVDNPMPISLPALRAYANVFDPSVWIANSRMVDPERAGAYRAVYYGLRDDETAISINRIANLLSIDLGRFDRLLAQLDDAPSAEERHEGRLDLHALHSIRQALMMHAFVLVGQLPRISERHDTNTRDLLRMVLDMQISDAVDMLVKIFPRGRDDDTPFKELTEAGSEAKSNAYGYDRIHRNIISPLSEIDRALHGISLAITHAYRAFG